MGYISVRNAHKEFMKDGEPLTILKILIWTLNEVNLFAF